MNFETGGKELISCLKEKGIAFHDEVEFII